MMSANLCFAEKYELSKDQRDYIVNILSKADIKGMEAPMLLKCAQSLQTPIIDKEVKNLVPPPETMEWDNK
jgi:predicted ATP-grasp superfamily ATP-dependent carboligase